MTKVGAGGVTITSFEPSKRYRKEYRKLTPELQEKTDRKLEDLQSDPRPPGLRFEKLQFPEGVYTIHVTGNYKVSFEVVGTIAFLRRVANHDEIDRSP